MLVRTMKRLGCALVPGSILLQSCALSSENLQNAAASGLESVIYVQNVGLDCTTVEI